MKKSQHIHIFIRTVFKLSCYNFATLAIHPPPKRPQSKRHHIGSNFVQNNPDSFQIQTFDTHLSLDRIKPLKVHVWVPFVLTTKLTVDWFCQGVRVFVCFRILPYIRRRRRLHFKTVYTCMFARNNKYIYFSPL